MNLKVNLEKILRHNFCDIILFYETRWQDSVLRSIQSYSQRDMRVQDHLTIMYAERKMEKRFMNSDTLSKLFSLNVMVIEKNLKGITPDESLFQPRQAGNCVNWVFGHIVATRNQVMKIIGERHVWSQEEAAPYVRGSAPLKDESVALPLSRMLTDLLASQNKLLTKLHSISPEELEEPVENGTVCEQLAILLFHEAYHAGQLGILRRLLGKPGAIK